MKGILPFQNMYSIHRLHHCNSKKSFLPQKIATNILGINSTISFAVQVWPRLWQACDQLLRGVTSWRETAVKKCNIPHQKWDKRQPSAFKINMYYRSHKIAANGNPRGKIKANPEAMLPDACNYMSLWVMVPDTYNYMSEIWQWPRKWNCPRISGISGKVKGVRKIAKAKNSDA